MAPSQKRRKQMEREQFYEEMKKALMELKPEGMEVTFIKVDKQNRMGLHGCTLSMPDAAAAPTFYLEDLYEAYLNGTAVEDIAEGVLEFAKENNRAVIPNGIDVVDYESARKHLGLMVIGAEENREYLESLVCEFIEGSLGALVSAHCFVVNISYSYEVSAVLIIVLIEIWNVLEVVSIYITFCCCYVRLYIIVEFYYFEGPAFFRKVVCDRVQDLCVRCRRCCYLDGLVFAASVT